MQLFWRQENSDDFVPSADQWIREKLKPDACIGILTVPERQTTEMRYIFEAVGLRLQVSASVAHQRLLIFSNAY